MNFRLSLFTLACWVVLGAAHSNEMPTCADACFDAAIASAGCAANDLLCQCTTGHGAIASFVTTCLFTGNPCLPGDLAQVQPAAYKICASVLASASVAHATPTPSVTANDTNHPYTTSTVVSSTSTVDSSTPSATNTSAAALNNNNNNNNNAGANSLSTGTKVGIGVGAGSGCLALTGALLFYLRRRLRRPKSVYPISESDSTEESTIGSEPPELKLPELGGFEKPMEFEVLERPVELEAVERPLELRDTSHIAELPG